MRIRATAGILFCCIALGAALGCSSQPTAPSSLGSPTVAAGSTTVSSASQQTAVSPSRFGKRTPGVVYVTSQSLYYDTFVVKDPLPMEGRFQLLANGETEFGPGQPGYLGGRWWEDTNGNGVRDAEDPAPPGTINPLVRDAIGANPSLCGIAPISLQPLGVSVGKRAEHGSRRVPTRVS